MKIITENLRTNVSTEQGDYILDGLLYCGKCNTAKQIELDLGGKIIRPYCICKCKAEELEEQKKEEEHKQFLMRVKRNRAECFQDEEMRKWNFAADDGLTPNITKIAMNYVEHFEEMKEKGKGLLFFGGVGTGKTFFSACIANALTDKGYSCLMTNFSRIVNTIQGMYAGKQAYIDGLNKYSLLVIDDLAAERDTEFMNEHVQHIIDARYRAGLPTIITTNLTNKELYHPEKLDKQRTYSRVLEMTIPVKVEGKDKRKENLIAAMKELNEKLGIE